MNCFQVFGEEAEKAGLSECLKAISQSRMRYGWREKYREVQMGAS